MYEGIAAVIVLAVPHLRKFEPWPHGCARPAWSPGRELHLILAAELLAPRKVVVEINMVDFQPVVGIGGKRLGHGCFGKPAAHDGEVPHTDSFRLVGLDIKDDRHTAFPGRFVDRKPIRIGGNDIPRLASTSSVAFDPVLSVPVRMTSTLTLLTVSLAAASSALSAPRHRTENSRHNPSEATSVKMFSS